MGWLLEGFNPLAEINFLVSSLGYRKQVGVNYGSLERQKLDVYSPKGEARDLPVIVFFYGGSLQSGRRKDYRFGSEAVTARGFVAVIPDYRVYPEVKFPTFIEDGASAVSWGGNHIDRFGGDPSRLFLMGHSAGAYIAAMLALNPRYLAQVGLSSGDLRGFIGLAGPYDFLPRNNPKLIEIFGAHDSFETQPINFINASAPPALLLHGAKDKIIRPNNTESLAKHLRAAKCPGEERVYPQYRHLMILFVLASPFQGGEPEKEEIGRFILAQSELMQISPYYRLMPIGLEKAMAVSEASTLGFALAINWVGNFLKGPRFHSGILESRHGCSISDCHRADHRDLHDLCKSKLYCNAFRVVCIAFQANSLNH